MKCYSKKECAQGETCSATGNGYGVCQPICYQDSACKVFGSDQKCIATGNGYGLCESRCYSTNEVLMVDIAWLLEMDMECVYQNAIKALNAVNLSSVLQLEMVMAYVSQDVIRIVNAPLKEGIA